MGDFRRRKRSTLLRDFSRRPRVRTLASSVVALVCVTVHAAPSREVEVREEIRARNETEETTERGSKNKHDDANRDADQVIRGRFGESEIVITTTRRLAGAIHSLSWSGKEFIDSHDHGRQLQSASNFDAGSKFSPETFNPTEAGSRHDGDGPTSTSRLLHAVSGDRWLQTTTRMAFWLRPGDRSSGNPAKNTTILSNHLLTKTVTIGYERWPNVIVYDASFTVPAGENHHYAQFEAVTGYMPAEFEAFFCVEPETGALTPLTDGPGEQSYPVILSTTDRRFAMGVFSPQQPSEGYAEAGYGRFRFVRRKVTKWNCVFRVHDPNEVPPGVYSFRSFVAIGDLETVRATLQALMNVAKKNGQATRD